MLVSDSEPDFITTDGWLTEHLRPVFMGFSTKNAKVITVALDTLQLLIALRAVSLSAILGIIQTMNDCISQDVNIQLKTLQTLLSLITHHSRQTTRKRYVLSFCAPYSLP